MDDGRAPTEPCNQCFQVHWLSACTRGKLPEIHKDCIKVIRDLKPLYLRSARKGLDATLNICKDDWTVACYGRELLYEIMLPNNANSWLSTRLPAHNNRSGTRQ
jgi:hypothetical protein